MSCFELCHTHIDAMITAGLWRAPGVPGAYLSTLRWLWRDDWHELTADTADLVGTMLAVANCRSVNYRYSGAEDELSYVFRRLAGSPNPVTVLKAIDCYRYQTCKHPAWQQSQAREFCNALAHRTIGVLPGYEDAPWEITDRHVFEGSPATPA